MTQAFRTFWSIRRCAVVRSKLSRVPSLPLIDQFSRYPIRDPFFKMLPRSLSNFMNAFTSSDHTTYPFATTNTKDFKNLMSVYLDATLRPLLKENDFLQEGWRIGPENPLAPKTTENTNDTGKNLVFKGVVYNEMKGQMSDASYLYYIRFQDLIFPDIHNSGGDPQRMTDLGYLDLKAFHAKNYHPSNAKFFTYGDMPLADHLAEIGRQLGQYERKPADETIKTPISLHDGPLYFSTKGPLDPLVDKEMQFKTSTSWLTGDTSDIMETFALRVISSLLLDGYGSPLYRGLIEAGLGPEWSPNTGFDDGGKVGIFSVGLSGVKEADVPRVKNATIAALHEICHVGFDKSKIDGILHQLEITLRHKTANFGMGVMQRLQSGWFNGVDPLDALAWDDIVTAFKSKLAEGQYLESLVAKYMLNDCTMTFTMEPSDIFGDELAAEEKERLASKIAEVTQRVDGEAEANNQLKAQESKLLEIQENARNQDLSCLPTVRVEDVPRQMQRKPIRYSSIGDTRVQWRESSTNGLTYFRAISLFEGLPAELRTLIPLYAESIMRIGTKEKSMEELEDLIKLKTGGISSSYFSSTSPANLDRATEGLSLSGHAMDSNVPAMYELLCTMLLETNFDGSQAEKHIRELLQSSASGALNTVAGSGHSYARRYAEASLTAQALFSEQVGGLTQIQSTAALAQRSPSTGYGDIIEKLKAIQSFAISNSASLRTAITCGRDSVSSNESALSKFLSGLPTSSAVPQSHQESHQPIISSKTFFPLPYQVYYSALAFRTVPYVHPASGPLQILSQLLTHKHLHHEIREKGGAYGGGAYSRALSGLFGMYSYRDPNPQNTMKVMQQAGQWAYESHFSDQDLQEAKLSVFQSLDAPESVSEEGMARFLSGIDEDMQQTRREQLLDVTKANVQEVAQKYIVERMPEATLAVLGEKADWARQTPGWSIKSLQISKAPVAAADGFETAL